METRANYVLIGAFALAGFLGLLVFLLVFARIELDRQFAYYEVRFTSVGGLSRASEVRFAGLPVGQVVDVRLAPERDGSVLVRLEVGGDVPVREDSVATIESMGVTGVSYVGISAGSPEAPLLDPTDEVPEIEAGRSVLQTITEDAPEILSEALTLMQQVSALFDETNQQKVQNILDNLERSSEELSQALVDFAGVTQTVGQATADIAYFTTILEPVVEASEATLVRIDTALETYTALAERGLVVLEGSEEVLESGRRAMDSTAIFLSDDLPVLVRELTAASEMARDQIDRLGAQAETLMAGFTETGTLATARLSEAEATIAATDAMLADLSATLDTVERAAAGFEMTIASERTEVILARIDTAIESYTALADRALVVLEDGEEVLLSGRRAMDSTAAFVADDLPLLVRELTAASEMARGQIDRLGRQAEALMSGFTETGTQATARLSEAEATIAATDAMLAELSATLDTVERAAAGFEAMVAGERTEAMLGRVDSALDAYTALGLRAMTFLDEGEEALGSGRRALDAVERVAADEMPVLLSELTATSEALRVQIDRLGRQSEALMAELTVTGARAGARLDEAAETLAATDRMLASLTTALDTMDRAAGNFDALITVEGSALIAETRAMIAGAEGAVQTISAAAENDLPAIVADIREATATANRVFTDVGANLIAASDRFDEMAETAEIALAEVTGTFARANTTLDAVDRALDTGERTLAAAERTFIGAERVIDEEISVMAADLRVALGRLDGAIAQVSDDIPEVSASLRSAAASAEEAFAEIGRMVAASGGPVRDFTTRALPQFAQLARETRVLITNLDRLARQIERNPARFILGTQTPEFRR